MRRLVLVSQEEIPEYASLWGIGLGTDIFTIEQIESMSPENKKQCLSLCPGDGVMLIGGNAFKYLRQFYHFGVRGENYSDCAKLRRLSIEGGIFAKCTVDIPERECIQDFMTVEFTCPVDFSWFRSKCIHTFQDAIKFLEYMDSLPDDEDFGFDYEASGMPLDKWFEVSGAALCTTQIGGFISFTDIRHEIGKESLEYKKLLERLGDFLVRRQKHIWTYNMQYEFQVSHRILGVDLYDLCDASVINVLDGCHMKKYSLKWTAQRVLQSTVWDSEFDRISDLIDSMLFTEEGKLKKDKHKVLKVDKTNFKYTPEWKELAGRYPSEINEMEQLLLEYWGNPFMCISSEILGKYCCLDSFYTLMIYKAREKVYSKTAFEVFLDNLRLACRLHSCGMPKNETYRKDYENYCKQQMAYGSTYSATARCFIKMEKHKAKMANINKYSPIAIKLLNNNEFFNGNAIEITKNILLKHIDTLDSYELGVDEGLLLLDFGPDFAIEFMGKVREAMEEAEFIKVYKKTGQKVLKQKIDSGIGSKKKLLSILSEKIKPLVGLDKIKPDDKKLVELEKYLYYERAYNELTKVSSTQLKDINNVPDNIYAFGKKFEAFDYYEYITENYYRSASPIENDEICLDFAKIFRAESAYIAALNDCTQQLNNAEKYYESLGINKVEDGFMHFMGEWKKYMEDKIPANQTAYPEKMYNLAFQYYNSPECDAVKNVWSSFDGYSALSALFPTLDKGFSEYEKPFKPEDTTNTFMFMIKIILHHLLSRKYDKIMRVYIGHFDKKKGENAGMFLATDKYVLENPKTHVVIREADKDEPGATVKMFARFATCEKSSKRWGSGYHTIVSHSDIKSTICSYPGCLLTYFDISSAEVKSAGYMAGAMAIERHGKDAKTELINTFNAGIDVYIRTCKVYLGEEHWNKLSGKEQKSWRKKFKTVTLGLLYGLGINSLAVRLNTTPEEAKKIQDAMFGMYPELKEYIESQQNYPMQHGGVVNTLFGDYLKVDEWKYYQKAHDAREKKAQEARIKRLGVNLPIQGGTSEAMSSGFFNDLRVAIKDGWNLTSFITVHDSNTCNLPCDKIWEIRKFYDKNFTDFVCDMTATGMSKGGAVEKDSGIKLLFDLEAGSSYQDSCSLKQISDDTIEFSGNAISLLGIMNRMNECPGLVYETDLPREDIKPDFIEDAMDRFIRERGCSFVMDKSKYKVKFKKLS